jgi:3-deoxy-manno-octulosonate cytidylyltransferase (CMP-KDO synthetase)
MNRPLNNIVAGIIPARFASTRFPGKPLAMIGNKPMVQRVYEQSCKALDLVFVATDDIRILNSVRNFGGNAVMTSGKHLSGTDRCAEAIDIIESEIGHLIDVIINIQGDEPFIKPEQISLLVSCFKDENVDIATLVRKVDSDEDLFNTNQPKVVISKFNDALYFSRSTIPFIRDADQKYWNEKHNFYKHVGIYGYRKPVLKEITALERSDLEKAESLEQNRWLENGFRIRTAETEWESIGIDSPEDIESAERYIKEFFGQ